MRKILLLIISLTIFSTSHSTFANVISQPASHIIEGSYIVTFKKDAGVVLPPNEANRGKDKVPFGEHGTGHSKSGLAATLGTTGEVAAIFETI